MLGITTLGMLAALAVAQDTDTTFAADGADGIEISNTAGEVVVRAWDRDEVRIRAEHSRRTEISVRRRRSTIHLSTEGRLMGGLADYEIMVPRGFSVTADGLYFSLDVEGVGGSVRAESVEGSLRVVGARGNITLAAINGHVTLESSEGIIQLSATSNSVDVRNVGGELKVEAISGGVDMTGMTTAKVEASTVSGSVYYEGTIEPGGEYWLSAHSGSVTLEIPGDTDAEVWAAAAAGGVSVELPGTVRSWGGGIHEFTLGSGGAEIEAESFSGSVVIREPRPRRER